MRMGDEERARDTIHKAVARPADNRQALGGKTFTVHDGAEPLTLDDQLIGRSAGGL
jgi:hypothetical protein